MADSMDDISTRVVIDGQVFPCTAEDLAAGRPTVLDGLNFTWGRETVVDQPDAGSASFTVRQQIAGQTGPADIFQVVHAGAPVQIWSTGGGRDVLCWAGEITAVTTQMAGDGALTAAVSCIDPFALLSNITIGDQPWPQQTALERVTNIMDATTAKIAALPGAPHWSYGLTWEMDAGIQTPQIAYRDVDAQPPHDLLTSLASSVNAAVWMTATADGPHLWIEDVTARPGLEQFWIDPATGTVYIVDAGLGSANVDLWSANDVVRDPVTWVQDPSQAVTVVELTWLEPGVDEDGNPTSTEQTITRSDSGLVDRFGVRQLSINTELASQTDADRVAFSWVAQSFTADWIITGLAIDTAVLDRPLPGSPPPITDADRLNKIMDLLDIRIRIGHRLSVINLPDWAPARSQSFYIEGGSYTWEDHRWQLELTGSANVGMGGSAIYEEFPDGVPYDDFEPSITWWDCYGVAAPDPIGTPRPGTRSDLVEVHP